MAYQFQDSIQRGLLYLAKSEENFLVQVMPMVKPDYFEFPSHQKFYSIIKDYYHSYRALPSDDQILEEAKELKGDNELLSDY